MKAFLVTLAIFSAWVQVSDAGGNTSIVDLDRVKSIVIEEEKITIIGSGMLRKRILSDPAHGDDSVFGQPAQTLHAKVTNCRFEVIPYYVGDNIKGVPGTAPKDITPEMKAQSLKWWNACLTDARKIKAGDAIRIGYQREKMTITSYFVTKIVGSGSLHLRKLENNKQ